MVLVMQSSSQNLAVEVPLYSQKSCQNAPDVRVGVNMFVHSNIGVRGLKLVPQADQLASSESFEESDPLEYSSLFAEVEGLSWLWFSS